MLAHIIHFYEEISNLLLPGVPANKKPYLVNFWPPTFSPRKVIDFGGEIENISK